MAELTTVRLALSYPDGAEPADVPADLKQIADRLAVIAAGWLPSDTLVARPAPSADYDRHLFFAHDAQEIHACVDAGNDGTYAWVKVYPPPAGVTDHGALSGLGDDDHPQYAKKAGDTFTAGAPADVPLTVKGAVDQTANLLSIRNNAGADLLSVAANGRLNLKSYHETQIHHGSPASGTVTLSPADASMHTVSPAGPISISFGSFSTGDSLYLRISGWEAGFGSITWPAGIYWQEGVIPALEAAYHHILSFVFDGGTIWATYAGKYAQ